jgi:hypothetical protein
MAMGSPLKEAETMPAAASTSETLSPAGMFGN